jgi:hypothetical protein
LHADASRAKSSLPRLLATIGGPWSSTGTAISLLVSPQLEATWRAHAELVAENLRGVLHALESNFNIKPTDEDVQMLQDVGFPYQEYNAKKEVAEDDPVHVSLGRCARS